MGKPVYTKEEWEQSRKMIWRKKEEISLRFDQAIGKVKKDREDSKRKQLVRLLDSVTPNSVSIGL
jgi:hypothetical protein